MASCALACAPLVQLQPAYVSGLLQVRPCLDSQLFERLDRRTLMAMAIMVDAAAERTEKVCSSGIQGHFSCSSSIGAHCNRQQICSTAMLLSFGHKTACKVW
eukprot:GHRQ01035792.1.p2 GENE.GHRQ01035792.1~~GHRQ01035792.1.p2  ORF type:complete len:102 (+),score=17.70 GHRQ01035792.1:281-586(+)